MASRRDSRSGSRNRVGPTPEFTVDCSDCARTRVEVSRMYKSAVLFIVLLIMVSSFTPATAEIVVFDDVIAVNKTIKLNAVTKGRFFPEGGRLVKFHINGTSLGANLSGGDGYAFFTYTPLSSGIFKLKAESGNDMDEGTLLVTAKKDRIVLIEIEVVHENLPFSFEPAKDSPGVLQRLATRFRIVYVTTLAGIEASRKVIRENSLPLAPVFKWGGAELLEELKDKGIKPFAIVASPGVMSDAVDIEKRYSFEDTEAGTAVKDWNALLNHLDRNRAK